MTDKEEQTKHHLMTLPDKEVQVEILLTLRKIEEELRNN